MPVRTRRTSQPVTKTFAYNLAPGGVWAGTVTDFGNAGLLTRQTNNIDVLVYGSRCELWTLANATYQLSVDGSPFATMSDGKNTGYITIFNGLADGPHHVRIRLLTFTIIDKGATWRVTGQHPRIDYPRLFAAPDAMLATSTIRSGYSIDGGCDFSSNAGGQPAWAGSLGASLRFKATCAALKLFCYQSATSYQLYVDGVLTGSRVSGDGNARYDWLLLGSGLDATTEHEYYVASSGQGLFNQIMPIGGSVNNSALTNKKTILFYGDSITQGVGASNGLLCFATLTAAAKTTAAWNLGLSGSTVHNDGSSSGPTGNAGAGTATARLAAVTARAAGTDRAVILYGINDLGLIPGSYSLATFQTDYQTMISTTIAGMNSGTKIYCLGILPRSGVTTTRDDMNAAISAAVTAAGNADTSYVNTDGWIVPATDTGDGLHPNDTGHAKIAVALAAVVA